MIDIKDIKKYSRNLKVLYVEDDKEFAKDTMEILSNFFPHLDLAVNGEDGLEKYINFHETNKKYYDLVISDIFMPKINGLELSKKIYTLNQNQPIIIISAHNESNYLVEFINIGIEYFIQKPFNIDEILSILYNSSKKIYLKKLSTKSSLVNLLNNYSWNIDDSILFYKNTHIPLTKKEQLFLKIIIKNKNSISSTDDILNIIWEDNIDATSNMLNPIISRLKKKLPKKLIKSIYGAGYMIEPIIDKGDSHG